MKLFIILFLTLTFGSLKAQSFEFFRNLIDLDQKTALSQLEDEGYELVKVHNKDGCSGYNLKRDSSSITYNVCPDIDGDLINVSIIERNLEVAAKRLFDANKDSTTLTSEISTVGENSSFIFIEEGSKEIYFIFNHFIELHMMEIANSYRYKYLKDLIENKFDFNGKKNGIALYRKILNATNKKGESIKDVLMNTGIRSDFNILDSEIAFKYLEEFRKSDKFESLRKEIDNSLLSDCSYVNKIQKCLNGMELWFGNKDNYYENLDEIMFKIALENNQFSSILMLDYICKSVQSKQ